MQYNSGNELTWGIKKTGWSRKAACKRVFGKGNKKEQDIITDILEDGSK